jgi:VanZ like family
MGDAVRTWGPVIGATLAALPVAVLVFVVLARWRVRAGTPPAWAWTASGAEVGMVVGTVPWIWMILTPRAGRGGVELIPGPGLVAVLDGGWSTAVVQIGGNLLVFAAFGALAPVRWRLGIAAVAAMAAAGSTTVEILQYALRLGRVSSVNDVALNTLGAVAAAFCTWRWRRAPRRSPEGGPGKE